VLKDFLNQPFHLLDRKQNRWILVIVTGIYVVLFMNLYLPFNVDRWYNNETVPLFLILSSFGLIGMTVLMISQLGIREILKIRVVRMYGIILWFLVELALLTVTMYLIYGTAGLQGEALINEIFLAFKYTALVIIIPYAGVLFYLYSTQQGENIDTLLAASNHLVNILDENGELHMAIDLEQILYLKSADNYVAVYFFKDGKVRKELVRTSLKRLETELDEFPIRRCHRSYMVNINKISVSMKSNQGLSLALKDYSEESIPVSKNYKAFFTRLIKQKEDQPR
jgi:DNA-binding LytR/AlgR family response regulator